MRDVVTAVIVTVLAVLAGVVLGIAVAHLAEPACATVAPEIPCGFGR
jgi:hypothetical protein